MAKKLRIESIYETGKTKRPVYKITVSAKELNHKKRADEILDDLLHYNMRLYKDGKRMPIGSLNLTIILTPFYRGKEKKK